MHPHRIDTHHHILPPKYLSEERERIFASAPSYEGTMQAWTPSVALDIMDRDGVATAVTSISAPGIWFGDRNKTRKLARDCNDYAAQMARDHKGRFGVFAVLPFPDVDGCLREIEYALDTLKVDGMGLMTSFGDQWPGDTAFAPVWDELNRRKAVVYFHPMCPGCCTDLLPGIAPAMMEFPFDTTRAIASLLFSGTFSRCPDIRFIFSHGGGTLVALAPRMAAIAERRPHLSDKLPNGAMHEFGRLYYDLVNAADPMVFESIRKIAGIPHLLYGSDFPFWDPAVTTNNIAKLNLSPADLRAIERDNALRLLPNLPIEVPSVRTAAR